MRLREIQHILAFVDEHMDYEATQLSGGNWQISEFHDVVETARRINETGALKPETDALLAMKEITRHVDDEVVVRNDTYAHFKNLVSQIKLRSQLMAITLGNMLPPDTAEEISVRLPDENDAAKIATDLTTLDKALSQLVVNSYVNGEVKVLGFDRGSNWVDIFLGTLPAVTIVGTAHYLIYEIRMKELDISGRKEVIRNLKLQNDVGAIALKALDDELQTYVDSGFRRVAEAGGVPPNDHDMRERIRFAVQTFAEMAHRGLEVHPSLIAPPTVRDKFPDPTTVAAALRQLEGPKKELGS